MLINDKNYKNYLKGISVVEVSGESCANCITLMPILNNIVSKYENVNLFHIEIDENSNEFIKEYEIMAVPTIIIFKDQKEYIRCRGYQPEEILELWIDSKIKELSSN